MLAPGCRAGRFFTPPEWRERARALGLVPEAVRALGGRVRSGPLDERVVEQILEQLAGADGLTRDRSAFTRRDVLQALSERLPAHASVSAADIERLADDFLASPRVVVLAEGAARESLRRADGRLIPPARAERSYSTPELLALERRILDHASSVRGPSVGVARPQAIERALRRRPSLAERAGRDGAPAHRGRRRRRGRRRTGGGGQDACARGGARGVGVAAALGCWARRSRGVLPASSRTAPASRARAWPRCSSASTAIRSDVLGRRAVLVLDEAAMIPTRELAALIEHARTADAKVVLLGDDRQLPAIGAGGAFGGLLSRVPVIELQENRRQLAEWERDALQALRRGDARTAVDAYARADRIVVGDGPTRCAAALVADWWASGDPAGSVMIAQRRVDVADLNGRAHALMRAAGALGEQELVVGDVAFAPWRSGARAAQRPPARRGQRRPRRRHRRGPGAGTDRRRPRWPAGLAAARVPRAADAGMAAAR